MYLPVNRMDTKSEFRRQIHLGLLILDNVPNAILMAYLKILAKR